MLRQCPGRLLHGTLAGIQLPLLRLSGLVVLLLPVGNRVLDVIPVSSASPVQLGLVLLHADVVVLEIALEEAQGLQEDVEGWSKPHLSERKAE